MKLCWSWTENVLCNLKLTSYQVMVITLAQTWTRSRRLIEFEQPGAYQSPRNSLRRFTFHQKIVSMEIWERHLRIPLLCELETSQNASIILLLTTAKSNHRLSFKPFSLECRSYGMARHRWSRSWCRRDRDILFLWRPVDDTRFCRRGTKLNYHLISLLTSSVPTGKHLPFCCLWKFW